jgi:hypothetical protein
MKYEVLEHFFGQPVEISLVSSRTYRGILGQSEYDDGAQEIVELGPDPEYNRRFSSWVLETGAIMGIRLIKPHVDDDNDDEDGNEKFCKDAS